MATTKKATASTAPAKKTAKKTSKTTAAKTTAAKTTGARKKAARKSTKKATETAEPTLLEREPATLLETAGYAAAGFGHDVVGLARTLPSRVESLRDEQTLASLRDRLNTDAKRYLASFEQVVDAKAAEGRRIVDDVSKDERVAKVLDQTASTRAQLKSALTSVVKTADVAVDAAGNQAGTARTQVKGAATTVRGSGEEAGSAVKGAVTSLRKVADVAVDAAGKQAGTARSQIKAASTSVRRTAQTATEAAAEGAEATDEDA